MRKLPLSFRDPAEERAFLEADNRAAVARGRACVLLALVMSAPFLTFDVLLSGGRAVVVAVLATGCAALVAVAAVTTWWRNVARHIQLVIVSVVVLYSWGASATATLTRISPDDAAFSSILLLLALVGVARVRFVSALVATALALPPALVVLVLAHPGVSHSLVLNLMCFTAFSVLDVTIALALERSRRRTFLAHRALAAERRRSERLLHTVIPEDVARRLATSPLPIADTYDDVTVLFADIVGFTPLAASLPAAEVVRLLDLLFGRFDDLCAVHGMEKIKTIGDAYMAVAGIRPSTDHAARAVALALAMQREAADLASSWPADLALRIGISSGPVVAGVIGRRTFAFDLWGDAVNTASRMEAHGRAGRIHVSADTHDLLADRYDFSGPHLTEVKGKGVVPTYFLLGPGDNRGDDRHVGVKGSPSHPERRRTPPCPEPADCPHERRQPLDLRSGRGPQGCQLG